MAKYNNKVVDIICQSLSQMSSKTAAASAAGIALVTFFEWYNTKPEFKKRVDETLDELLDRQKYIALQSIFKAMETDYRAAEWFLEKRFANEFGKPQQIELTGKVDHNVKQIQINVIDDGTKTLMERTVKLLEDNKNSEEIIDAENLFE